MLGRLVNQARGRPREGVLTREARFESRLYPHIANSRGGHVAQQHAVRAGDDRARGRLAQGATSPRPASLGRD
jgi:hypothetical protein